MKRDNIPDLIIRVVLFFMAFFVFFSIIRIKLKLEEAKDTLDLVEARTRAIQRLISNTKDTIKPNVLYEDTWGKIILVKEEDL